MGCYSRINGAGVRKQRSLDKRRNFMAQICLRASATAIGLVTRAVARNDDIV